MPEDKEQQGGKERIKKQKSQAYIDLACVITFELNNGLPSTGKFDFVLGPESGNNCIDV